MNRLSVIVLTRNEEEALPGLLASIRGLADEVIVVDSGSTDGTVELARAAGARVVPHEFVDFGRQRAFATSLAIHDLVLSLDADERVSPELASAIRAELARPAGELCAGYRIHFRHRALGRSVRFGAMGWDRRIRIFDRRRGGYDAAPVHEKVMVDGPVRDLPGRCDHEGYRDVAEARTKLRRYAEAAARERYRRGARFRPWHLLRWPAGFAKRYVVRLGFLDGLVGLRLALLYARYDLDKALWLRRLERELGGARGRGALSESVRALPRRALLWLATQVFPQPRASMPPLAAIRKVLVVRIDERVGNQLLTTPLLRALKLGLPAAEVHLLAAARQARVVSARHVDRVIPFEKRLAFRRPWRLVALLRALRRARYDVVVEAGHWSGFSLTASLLARAFAGGAVVGHDRGESARFLSHPVHHDLANGGEVQAKLELLRPFGLLPRGLELETDLGCDPAPAEAVLARFGIRPERLAVLNPGARMADRRWPPDSHAAVARGLAERGLSVLVVWGPGEKAIALAVAERSGAALAPPTDLELLAGLLRRARLCVSNNSGPMHLAVAVSAPTVGVFLGDDARRWGHALPSFAAAEPQSEGDTATVLVACDRMLAIAPRAAVR